MTARLARLCLALCACLGLAACASIPTDSPVGHIDTVDSGLPGVGSRAPDGPAPGASVEDIVRGFLAAGTGTSNNFAVARSFLTEAEAQDWNPLDTIALLPSDTSLSSLNSEVTSDQKTLTMSPPVEALINSAGIYSATKPGTESSLSFSLRQENGEWRISSAPDGLLIPQSTFPSLFLNYSLQFYTSDHSYLVPDSRWFLKSSSTPTAVVQELLRGPAPYLAGAVSTAIPEGVRLGDSNVVSVDDSEAQVTLDAEDPTTDDREKGLIRKQISATLTAIPSISSVQVMIGGQTVPAELEPNTQSNVQVDGPSVALSKNSLVRISGTTVARVPHSPDMSGAAEPSVAIDDSFYTYLSDHHTHLRRLNSGDDEATTVGRGKDLVGPSIDRFSTVWTAERDNDGQLLAIEADGTEHEVHADFLADRRLLDLEVSRNGNQLALLSENSDGTDRIDVIGLPRDRSGAPGAAVGENPLEIGSGYANITDVAWMGSTSLVALAGQTGDTPQPVRLPITGPAEQLGTISGGTRIAAGEDTRSILVTSESGEIYSYNSGGAWQKLIDATAIDPSYPG